MKRPFENNHFIWLTIALIGLMLSGAISFDLRDSLAKDLIEYSSVALLLLSLLSLQTDRKWAKAFLIIVGAILAVVVAHGITDIEHFGYIYVALLLVFLLAAAWFVGHHVLLTGTVDLNIIVGSVALYLIIGLTWSLVYAILLEIAPGSLSGIEAGSWFNYIPSTTYFSFVTLTTLGYGDIHPTTPIFEVLAILEAMTGLFYMAAVVASLIGSRGRIR